MLFKNHNNKINGLISGLRLRPLRPIFDQKAADSTSDQWPEIEPVKTLTYGTANTQRPSDQWPELKAVETQVSLA